MVMHDNNFTLLEAFEHFIALKFKIINGLIVQEEVCERCILRRHKRKNIIVLNINSIDSEHSKQIHVALTFAAWIKYLFTCSLLNLHSNFKACSGINIQRWHVSLVEFIYV